MSTDRATINTMRHAHLIGQDATTPDCFISIIGHCQSHGYFHYNMDVTRIHMRFMHSGRGWGIINEVAMPINAGDITVFWPGDHIELRDETDAPWNFHWIQFSGRQSSWAFQRSGFEARSHKHTLSTDHHIFGSSSF